jgi:hypothetical protein
MLTRNNVSGPDPYKLNIHVLSCAPDKCDVPNAEVPLGPPML